MSKLKGRYKDPIWNEYEEITSHSEGVKKINLQKCKSCGKLVSAKVQRLKNHKIKCKVETENSESDIEELLPKKGRTSTSEESTAVSTQSISMPSASASLSSSATSLAPLVRQPSISQFTVRTSSSDTQKLNIQVARYFYSCNIPFSTAEQPEFVKLITMLRPGYRPPNRKQLSGTLLDTVHEELAEEAKCDLNGKSVTLVQDGWSTIHNDPVIANCVSTGTTSYFLSAIDTGYNKKTADYCLQLAKEAKTEAETKYGCKVRSFVSDNEKKMQNMRLQLQKEFENEFIVVYGCASHYLNLLGQDIVTQVGSDSIMKRVIEVQKYFRNHHQPGAWLKEFENSIKPQLPGETRWNSQLLCLETFLRNREFFLKIVDEHEDDIDNNIVRIINNINLYKEAKSLHSQLQPISAALNKLQGEKATIADACIEWLNLLENEVLKPYEAILKHRFDQAVTPAHMLAYMLNPKHLGSKLSEEQEEEVRKWILQVKPSFLPLMIAFQGEAKPFPETYFTSQVKDNVDTIAWWKSMKRNKNINSEFVEFVLHLQNCIASSACIERIFSNFSFIQNKLRNRLGLETATKLVACYKLLNKTCLQESDW